MTNLVLFAASLAIFSFSQGPPLDTNPEGNLPEGSLFNLSLPAEPSQINASRILIAEDDLEVWVTEDVTAGISDLSYRSVSHVKVTLTSSLGVTWISRNLDPSESLTTSAFALNRLPEGCYTLTISNEKSEVRLPVRK